MKGKNRIKILLDLGMAVIFALMFNKMVIAGLAFHEIAGLSLGLAFIIHMLLNWKWIVQVTKNSFGRKINPKTRIAYFIDVLLFICVATIIFTGTRISRVVFSGSASGTSQSFKFLHISVAYLALMILGIHIGLHWGWVMNTVKNIFYIKTSKTLVILSRFVVVIILAAGIYNMAAVNYVSKLSLLSTAIAGKQLQGPAGAGSLFHPDSKGDSMIQTPMEQNDATTGSTLKGPGQGGYHEENSKEPSGQNRFRYRKASHGNGARNVSEAKLLYTYISIMAVPAIITYYIEKLLFRRKKRNASTAEATIN